VVTEIVNAGYSASQLILQFHDKLVGDVNLNELQKSLISQKLARIDRCLLDGADEHLQLLDLAYYTVSVL